jgi:GT2 family glycosyltransferase/glycosyltransferase involved in cell wall biosynthesis
MHRSGTSLLTRICNLLGADLGPDIMPPAPDNPAGFWEHRRIAEIDDRIFGTAGIGWNDPLPLAEGWQHTPETREAAEEITQILTHDFADSPLPSIKDPRLCRLLPLWQGIIEGMGWQPRYLLVARNPIEVERSLAARNGLPPAQSFLLWLRYCLESERDTRGQQRVFMTYDQLMKDWRGTLEPAYRKFGLPWPGPQDPVFDEIDRFTNAGLRHHAADFEELSARPHLARFVGRVYDAWSRSAGDPDVAEREFPELQTELEDILYLLDPVYADLRKWGTGLAQARAETIVGLEQQVAQQNDQIILLREDIARLDGEVKTARGIAQARQGEIRQLGHSLTAAQGELEIAKDAIGHRDGVIRDRDQSIDEITHSTSWRLTGPLRRAGELARQLGSPKTRRLVRKAPRALHVLRTEGPGAVVNKARRHLMPASDLAAAQLVYDDLPTEFPPLAFADPKDPDVSVVIPVFNKWPYTYNCLRALHRLESSHSFEIIVVDDASSDETMEQLGRQANVRTVQNDGNQGFIRSCNAGAAAARGTYLVFLNNDTQVQAGWLDALIETFSLRSDAGLVGSQLVYPDGRLQEAGGIVWRDGSAWNLGRFEDPNTPEYSYLREADYCSGASIAIARALFEQLDGFDELFLPAYYEDTDLAFRVRAAGHKVYYQPASRIVHFEGITSGTETTSKTGVKRFQEINAEKFFERWRDTLSRHRPNGEQPGFEKERSVERRVLVCDACMITPDRDSGSLRMYNMLQLLQDIGFKVTFAPLNLEARQPYLGQLQRRGIECLYGPYVDSVDDHIREHGWMYDAIILSRADVAQELLDAAKVYSPDAQVVFDTVDLHFLREMREAEIKQDRHLMAIARKRRNQEVTLIRRADITFVVSPAEKQLLEAEVPGERIDVVSNIHEIYGRKKAFDARCGILFVGGFNHPPNADAVQFFVSDVLPLVHAQIPDAELMVVGDSPPHEIQALENERVRILGYVPELAPWLEQCRISVAPLRYGAGVKGKVNMSLAHGVPVVGTTVAVEGMFLEDGESVLIADDAAAFAKAVISLYTDEALWLRLSDAGLDIMHRYFSFDAARQALDTALLTNTSISTASDLATQAQSRHGASNR